MRFVWISALKDLAWLRRDPFSTLTWLAIPFCMGLLIHLVFSGGQATPQGRLLIADSDGTVASNVLSGQFTREPLSKMFVVENVTEEQGRARIGRGEASAFLLIPEGLQNDFLLNRPCHVQLFTNPGQTILPKIAVESLSMTVDAGFYLQHVATGPMRDLATTEGVSEEAVSRLAVETVRLGNSLRKYVDPPLIRLETVVVQEKKTNVGVAAFFFPSMIFLALLLMANGLAGEIWTERAAGTLRRLSTTPASLASFLTGRLLTVLLLYAAVSLAGVAVGRWLAGAQVANVATASAWAALSGITFYLALLLVALAASSRRAANVWGNIVVFPFALIGGCFFPFGAMPAWMRNIGKFTPNGWAMLQFQDVLAGSAKAPQLLAAAAGLAAVCALAFLLALRQLRRGFAA
jgi:ABC-2 type transport system permease protein